MSCRTAPACLTGMSDRNVNAADGVGSQKHEPRTHPARADGRWVYKPLLRHDAGPTRGEARIGADVLLHERPRRLDRIQIMRVRWQVFERRATLFDQAAQDRRFVGLQIVRQLVRSLSAARLLPPRWRGCILAPSES